MAKHDIVTYNPTTQGFETELGDNTAQIKGDSEKVFSVESGSTNLFSVGTSTNSITLNSHITASGNISSSLASTASFDRIVFTKITGDGSQMTNVNEIGHVSGAAQVASRISGAFNAGFVTLGDISGSVTSTGSFGKVFANTYVGDASQMTNVNEDGHFSGSAQLASDISGSFNKGFGFENSISGSLTSSGSFGRLNWSGQISANASEVTNLNENGFISSSAQLSADISGSFNKGFEFENSISGSATSTGSFGRVNIDGVITGDASQVTGVSLSTNTVSGSAQLASDISGSFNKGLLYSGTISGSMESTASFFVVSASTYNVTNVSHINTPLQQIEGLISQSSQIVNSSGVSRISGSFIEGFEFDGTISGSATSTGSFKRVDAVKLQGDASRIGGITQTTGLISSSAQLAADISGSFNKGFQFQNFISGSVTSTGSFTRVVAGMFQGDFSAITANDDGNLSGSSGIASDISGSFNKGFELTGLTATQLLSASFVGVSGSTFAHAGNATTMSISSLCGSDFDYRLEDGLRHGMIKGTSYGTGVWSAGPNRNDDQSGFAAVGTQNAYLAAGGYKENKDGTEKFDGTSFSFSANMSVENNALAGFGTQNAAAFMGGFGDFDGTELYNGATYSDAANMAQDRRYAGTAGTQNAGIIFAGTGASPYPNKAQTENFNGDTWTEVADLILARGLLASAGTENSAIGAGGLISPAAKNETELWNGTSWTETANLNYARYGSAGIGTQNHFIVAGGYGTPAFSSCTEEWNGTSWAAATALSTARTSFTGGQGGLGCAGIVAGGQIGSPTATNTVELWDAPSATTASLSNFKSDTFVTNNMTVGVQTGSFSTASFNTSTNKPFIIPYVDDAHYDTRQFLPGSASLQETTCGSCSDTSNGYDNANGQLSIGMNGILNITFQTSSFDNASVRGIQAGAWSAGPNMILARAANMVGSSNSSLAIGGTEGVGSATGCPEAQHFDGISWRQGGSITHYKYAGKPGSGGAAGQSENDAASYGFYTSAGHGTDANNMYNGVVWTEGPRLPDGSYGYSYTAAAGGSSFSSIVFGCGTKTEEFNGTAWNEAADLNSPHCNLWGFGTQNAGVAHSGNYNLGRQLTEHYDGTTWTSVNNSLLAHNNGDGGAYGTQNSAHSNKQGTCHQSYDGVTWSRTTDSSVTRFYAGMSGNAQNAMMIGGRSPSDSDTSVNTVEVFHDAFISGSYLLTNKIGSNLGFSGSQG